MNRIEEAEDFPDKWLERYTIDEKQYRELIGIGMKIVNDARISLTKMCNYLYVARFERIFIQMWLDFIQGNGVNIDPMELIIYMGKQNIFPMPVSSYLSGIQAKSTIFRLIVKYLKKVNTWTRLYVLYIWR